jgi:hypothetical protein
MHYSYEPQLAGPTKMGWPSGLVAHLPKGNGGATSGGDTSRFRPSPAARRSGNETNRQAAPMGVQFGV